jgi:FMN phosphatase YigB (HAD superfamily)
MDDTLLRNDIDRFLPQYLAAFSKHLDGWIDARQFVRAMMLGIQAMEHNRRPDCTLQEAFESVFFRALNVDPGEFYRRAEEFYDQVFPSLQQFTTPIPEAVRVLETARQRGDRLAIATNPLFPLTAILQRLAWGGMPAGRFLYETIGTFDQYHFAKPDPAYFAEVLAHMGWPEGPVALVGDDPVRDVAAGTALGLPVYWIPRNGQQLPEGVTPAASGDIEGLLPWLDSADPESLKPDYGRLSALPAILRSTPAALDGMCRPLPSGQWKLPPAPGEWTLTEVACHLRDVEAEVNLPRLEKLLESENPFLAGQDTDRWAEERNYVQQDGRRALYDFIELRKALIQKLEDLEPQAWQLAARHAIFGPTRLLELVGIMAAHDRLHVQQARAVILATSD